MNSYHLVGCLLVLFPFIVHSNEPAATPAGQLTVRPGFEVELLHSARKDEGSWISMSFDDAGRILVARDKVGIGRISLRAGAEPTYELVNDSLEHCRGILYAHESLYVNATNSMGFYRLQDTTGDGQFDKQTLLKKFDYASRYGHGQNQIALGPDGMLYLVMGNDMAFPEGFDADSPYRDPKKDRLLPNPHDSGQDDRVGYILRTDAEGQTWQIIAGGLRNQVDLAFNREGEMFTWDADMEWDIGQPWYRPTRLNHIVSGGEYGWRWGSGKWPDWQPDALQSNLDTGLASPTGLLFGEGSRFPEPWRSQFLLADWQNGRILAATPTPVGASYQFTYESFLEGSPLNVADMVFGPDGDLYFITGGRNSQSGLYRVRYTGEIPSEREPEQEAEETLAAREQREKLERFHRGPVPGAIDTAWPHLRSSDPWIRFAARLAIERQDLSQWRERALSESNPVALLALARSGETNLDDWLASFHKVELSKLSADERVFALRTLSLAFIRIGDPSKHHEVEILEQLSPLFPNDDIRANRQLLDLLIFLNAENMPEAGLDYLQSTPTQEEQIYAAMSLLHSDPSQWSSAQWKRILEWLNGAKRFRGGHSFAGVLKTLREDYLALLDKSEASLPEELVAKVRENEPLPVIASPSGSFVKAWTLDDFESDFSSELKGRDLKNGRRAATATMCLVCHRVGNEGGQMGPDLTRVGGRFDVRTLLESILDPSAVIAPKYRLTDYHINGGKVVTGSVVGVSAKELRVEINSFTQEVETVERAEITKSEFSKISVMPPALIYTLERDDILDLLAWLKSGAAK